MNRINRTARLAAAAVTLVAAGLASSAAAAADAPLDLEPAAPVVQLMDAGEIAATDHLAATFPTYWIGELPPYPPYGYVWRFTHRDCYGRAHWRLGFC